MYRKEGRMKPKHTVNFEQNTPKTYHITYIQTTEDGYELVDATNDTFTQKPITISTPDDVSENELIEQWSGKYFHESLKPHLHSLVGYALTTNTIMNTILFSTPKGRGGQTIWDTGCDPTHPYEQDLVGAIFHISKALRKAIERTEYDNHRDFEHNRWVDSIWSI